MTEHSRSQKFFRASRRAAQRVTRSLLVASFVIGLADTAAAFQIAIEAAGPNYLAVLSLNSLTDRPDAGCGEGNCGAVKPDQQAPAAITSVARARNAAMKAAAVTLQSGGSVTSINGTQITLGTFTVNLQNLSRRERPGGNSVLVFDDKNERRTSVISVARGWTMPSMNLGPGNSAVFSDVLYNIANSAGITWDGALNSESNSAKNRIPIGILEGFSHGYLEGVDLSRKDVTRPK